MNNTLNSNFPNLLISSPLFYSWPIGIRFEIGTHTTGEFDTAYFDRAYERVLTIFNSIFIDEDLTLIHQEYSDGRKRIKKSNPIFRIISEKEHKKICYRRVKNPYYQYKKEHINRFSLDCKKSDLNISELFTLILKSDFGSKYTGETFLTNNTKTIVLHLYDDRGMDIISSSKDQLKPIYKKFHRFILDYDREVIDTVFAE